MRTQLECMEVCLAMDNEPTESLWVRTKEVTGMGDIIVGVSYRPPDQKEVDEALYRQLEAASRSQALVLNIYWRENTAGHKQFRRFLKSIDDNFLTQVTEEPMRGALLDLIPTTNTGLVGDVKGNLGGSDHEILEFRILR